MPVYRVRGTQTLLCEWIVEAEDSFDAEMLVVEDRLPPTTVLDIYDTFIDEDPEELDA